jgi:hypothetical protein
VLQYPEQSAPTRRTSAARAGFTRIHRGR